jgi:hypothetical protein
MFVRLSLCEYDITDLTTANVSHELDCVTPEGSGRQYQLDRMLDRRSLVERIPDRVPSQPAVASGSYAAGWSADVPGPAGRVRATVCIPFDKTRTAHRVRGGTSGAWKGFPCQREYSLVTPGPI